MLKKHFGFLILTALLNGGLCIDSSTLKCSELRKDDQLICVVFDLQIYHEMTKIKHTDDGMYGIKFDALYIMSPLMYYLPTNIFNHFPNITELKIITDIPALLDLDSTFGSLNQLKTIQIINQKLKKLDSEQFRGARKVTSLYLTSNEIERIHDEAFVGLSECKFLDLRNNRIRVMRMEQLMHMPKLWSVNLENNRLFTVFTNIFEKNSIVVADFSYNLIRVVESMDPIEKVLRSTDKKALFSLQHQLCKRFGPKALFTPKSIMEQIKSKLDACQLYYVLPTYCNSHCKSCIRYDLVSEEDEDDYDENENWDGGIFGEGVQLPPRQSNATFSEQDDPGYELVTLMAENSRLKSFCMSGNFSGSMAVYPPNNNAASPTCSAKIVSIASVVSSVQNLLTEHQTTLEGVLDELKVFSQEHHAIGPKPLPLHPTDESIGPKPLPLTPADVEVTEPALTTESSDTEESSENVQTEAEIVDETTGKLEETSLETVGETLTTEEAELRTEEPELTTEAAEMTTVEAEILDRENVDSA